MPGPEYIQYPNSIIPIPADALAPKGARPSAGTAWLISYKCFFQVSLTMIPYQICKCKLFSFKEIQYIMELKFGPDSLWHLNISFHPRLPCAAIYAFFLLYPWKRKNKRVTDFQRNNTKYVEKFGMMKYHLGKGTRVQIPDFTQLYSHQCSLRWYNRNLGLLHLLTKYIENDHLKNKTHSIRLTKSNGNWPSDG